MDLATFFMQQGAVLILLGLLARAASGAGFSPIPLYLIAGLFFGDGGVITIDVPEEFVDIGLNIGVILLMFMLGLTYRSDELISSLRDALPYGLLNFALNFPPGFILGLLLGWGVLPAVLMGGITYATASAVVAKTLQDLNWLGNRETSVVLSVLVLEDLSMSLYLPIVAALLVGGGLMTGILSLTGAIVAVLCVLFIAIRYGDAMSRILAFPSHEAVLLTTMGIILVVSGIAQQLQVSAAVGAFLVGIALSDPVAEQVQFLISPLRDLSVAVFFFFFGLNIDPGGLFSELGIALILGGVTFLTKFATGWWAAFKFGIAYRGRIRAGVLMTPRGEFSIVIAELANSSGLNAPRLVSLATTYVLIMVIVGPVMARSVEPVLKALQKRKRARAIRTAIQTNNDDQ